jgi:hypothetical protein
VLVAGGLGRRAGRRELEQLLTRDRARDFRGSVVVHDIEGDDLAPLGSRQVARTLVDTDLVVTVTAAESACHGGPATLAAACDPVTARGAVSPSLLELSAAPAWRDAVNLERELGRRVHVLGVSLVLDHPRPQGRLHGWPSDAGTVARVESSLLRRAHGVLPRGARSALLGSIGWQTTATAALAGPPSVAHAEALLRGVALRAATLEHELDVVVLPVGWQAARPTGAPHGLAAAHLTLGVALRLWRQRAPLAPGGTVVVLHDLRPTFGRAEAPSAVLYEGLRDSDPDHLRDVENGARSRRGAIESYRAGRASHPLQPFADWEATAPIRRLAGRMLAGGCRDAVAARRLGFIPSHSARAAIEMALGTAGADARVGVLLAPPYPPLVVG